MFNQFIKTLKSVRYHIAYWIFATLVLLFAFRSSWGNHQLLFFYVGIFLPIVLGTSYFFNFVLIPKYYLTRRYARFSFYTFCTAIVSWYLEMLVLAIAFATVANFSYKIPNTLMVPRLIIVLWMLVLVGSLLFVANQIIGNRQVIQELMEEKEKMKKAFLEIMSNRRITKIPYDEIIYIESLSDYIKVVTAKDEIRSKEKISKLAERLPDVFLRIHRSFIINTDRIKERSLDQVLVDEYRLNIGRSYRKSVKEVLNSRDTISTVNRIGG